MASFLSSEPSPCSCLAGGGGDGLLAAVGGVGDGLLPAGVLVLLDLDLDLLRLPLDLDLDLLSRLDLDLDLLCRLDLDLDLLPRLVLDLDLLPCLDLDLDLDLLRLLLDLVLPLRDLDLVLLLDPDLLLEPDLLGLLPDSRGSRGSRGMSRPPASDSGVPHDLPLPLPLDVGGLGGDGEALLASDPVPDPKPVSSMMIGPVEEPDDELVPPSTVTHPGLGGADALALLDGPALGGGAAGCAAVRARRVATISWPGPWCRNVSE